MRHSVATKKKNTVENTHGSQRPSQSQGWMSSPLSCTTSVLLYWWTLGCGRCSSLRFQWSPPSPPTCSRQFLFAPGSPPPFFLALRWRMCLRSPPRCDPWWWFHGRQPARTLPGRGRAGCRRWRRTSGSASCQERGRERWRRERRRVRPSRWGNDLERTDMASVNES